MTISLAAQARSNRLAALAHLRTLRENEGEGGTICDLAAARSSRKPTPVFFSRRMQAEPERMAA
ncbi:hypothetical protein SAMN05444007_107247 [Cribrihabitans marinus]|uniref:Uncharacterized protein n=1 Tax=Cribrihabitans marinus TaxID=1227549 RepID=A0A1H7BZ63_9RHOB|nr:hypothetical protein [Cribrihabitans marinus]GGH33281.1 hypothetical protein GCM10010973_25280 [Cribrihabitans marinus]SEJ82496.1 hypothetical protein SAMN05444007_107247 [Cribrihabitans marinus]